MPTDFHSAPRPWAGMKYGLLQYVELFLGKLGRAGKRIHYVDGFAGSGRLEDGTEGSPLRVARIQTVTSTWPTSWRKPNAPISAGNLSSFSELQTRWSFRPFRSISMTPYMLTSSRSC